MLILISGLPGSGKTTLASAFSAKTGAHHLNSDLLRQELGLMGHYDPKDKEKVYASLLDQTKNSPYQWTACGRGQHLLQRIHPRTLPTTGRRLPRSSAMGRSMRTGIYHQGTLKKSATRQ